MKKLSNSNQSGGVAFLVRACHSYEVVEGVSFEQCDVDDLWISIKLENNKSFIVGNVIDIHALELILLKKLS